MNTKAEIRASGFIDKSVSAPGEIVNAVATFVSTLAGPIRYQELVSERIQLAHYGQIGG